MSTVSSDPAFSWSGVVRVLSHNHGIARGREIANAGGCRPDEFPLILPSVVIVRHCPAPIITIFLDSSSSAHPVLFLNHTHSQEGNSSIVHLLLILIHVLNHNEAPSIRLAPESPVKWARGGKGETGPIDEVAARKIKSLISTGRKKSHEIRSRARGCGLVGEMWSSGNTLAISSSRIFWISFRGQNTLHI